MSQQRWCSAVMVGLLVACGENSRPEPAPSGRPTPAPYSQTTPPVATPDSSPTSSPADKPTEMTHPTLIPIEEAATYPRPGTAVPTSIAFVPGGEDVTFLYSPERNLVQALYRFDPAAGELSVMFEPPGEGDTEANFNPEERLRRERLRIRTLGVTQYRWARDTARLLVPLRGGLWVQEGVDGEPYALLAPGEHPILDPRFSPDGTRIAYVSGGALWTVAAKRGATPKRVSPVPEEGVTYGLAEYIAQEEMDRRRGFWWSRDSASLAFEAVDERAIESLRIEHQGAMPPTFEEHRYPFAGRDNAKVRLGVVSAKGGETRWLDLNATDVAPADRPHDLYLARVHWLEQGDLLVEVQNRAQHRLDLIRYRIPSGEATLAAQQTSPVWINLHTIFQPLDELVDDPALQGGFIWATERDGFRHLVLHGSDGQEVRALTSGSWMVDQLVGFDAAGRFIYVTGTLAGPTQKQLYRVRLDGGDPERVTEGEGVHEIVMNDRATRFVDVYSTPETPPTVTVRRARDGEVVAKLKLAADPRVAALDLEPPQFVDIQTRDGVTLHGAIYTPIGKAPFPTIVAVYGGPHVQRVTQEWAMTADTSAQYLRSQGFLVFKLDNRGSARRGLEFEGAIRHRLGDVELRDQVDGVHWLVEHGLADPDRVGILGWSYGGTMAALGLARAPEVFKAAVAGAPVTAWDGYDTHYTERYMGQPSENPEGYLESSVIEHVDGIRGNLLLIHGLLDENVHFRHTARLINALIRANKDYSLVLFPDERHMPRALADRVYIEKRVRDFFLENL